MWKYLSYVYGWLRFGLFFQIPFLAVLLPFYMGYWLIARRLNRRRWIFTWLDVLATYTFEGIWICTKAFLPCAGQSLTHLLAEPMLIGIALAMTIIVRMVATLICPQITNKQGTLFSYVVGIVATVALALFLPSLPE